MAPTAEIHQIPRDAIANKLSLAPDRDMNAARAARFTERYGHSALLLGARAIRLLTATDALSIAFLDVQFSLTK
jgi:hypothetical protein